MDISQSEVLVPEECADAGAALLWRFDPEFDDPRDFALSIAATILGIHPECLRREKSEPYQSAHAPRFD